MTNSFREDSALCAERIFAGSMPGEGNERCTNIPLGQEDVPILKAMKRGTQDCCSHT